MKILDVFSPNKVLDRGTLRIIIATQVVLFIGIWLFSSSVFLPKPMEVLSAFLFLWNNEGLGSELVTSFLLNLEAIGIATALSLLLAYASVIPFCRPIIALVGKLRFLSLAGLTFFFTMMASSGHELKLYLLVFSISVFFVTGMADVVAAAPKEKFDLARTLGMTEWRTVLEVIVFGEADKAFDVMRQNAAMGFMFLTMVEGISRSGGGIGALLLDQNKHFHLSAVFAIQLCILVVGIGQDYMIGLLRKIICPYADLALERK